MAIVEQPPAPPPVLLIVRFLSVTPVVETVTVTLRFVASARIVSLGASPTMATVLLTVCAAVSVPGNL